MHQWQLRCIRRHLGRCENACILITIHTRPPNGSTRWPVFNLVCKVFVIEGRAGNLRNTTNKNQTSWDLKSYADQVPMELSMTS